MRGLSSSAAILVAAVGLGIGAYGIASSVGAADRTGLRHTPVVAAVERAAPAVVNITTDISHRRAGVVESRGSGSGVIVHSGGYVVTNSHVVRDASRIYVELSKASGSRGPALTATLLEDDPNHDLALLRVTRAQPFPAVTLFPSRDVMVGETAIAIGNPYGLGDTVTVGIVSAVGRTAALPTGVSLRNLFQTDASINRGNSGGALLNLDGDLIGINCSVHPSAQGISFTVPSDDVLAMLRRHIAPAARTPAPTASAPAPAPRVTAAPKASLVPPPTTVAAPAKRGVGLGLRMNGSSVVVASVDAYSSAELAGVLPGDVVVDVNGKRAVSGADVANAVAGARDGTTVTLGLLRGGLPRKAILVVSRGS